MMRRLLLPAAALCVTVLLASGVGCRRSSYDRYTPAEAGAREALEVALTTWQNGGRPGRIDGSSLPIEAVDSKWIAGQRLTQFEILGEEQADTARCFSVRLRLANGRGDQTVRYYVLGRGPVWVYREEDYQALSGTARGM
jgi:hypothetical protein